MPQYQAEKLLRKSKLSAAYGKLASAGLQRAVIEEYEKLLDENDLSNKMLAGHMKGPILPAVALYRFLPGRGHTRAEALPRSALLCWTAPNRWQDFLGPRQAPAFLPAVPGDVPRLDEARLWGWGLGA